MSDCFDTVVDLIRVLDRAERERDRLLAAIKEALDSPEDELRCAVLRAAANNAYEPSEVHRAK